MFTLAMQTQSGVLYIDVVATARRIIQSMRDTQEPITRDSFGYQHAGLWIPVSVFSYMARNGVLKKTRNVPTWTLKEYTEC